MRGSEAVRTLLTTQRAVRVADHPSLKSAVVRMCARGETEIALPGVAVAAPASWIDRVVAVGRHDPAAIITGRAAAALSYWPGLSVSMVDVASHRQHRVGHGIRFHRRDVPGELVTPGPIRLTTPALTALDLCATELGGDAIDIVLRHRAARIQDLRRALELTPGRRGNVDRRRLLVESRAEPWSAAERTAHRLMDGAGITGWVANHPVKLMVQGQVVVYYLDIAFRGRRLAIEIDGRAYHSSAEAFETDRRRQNDVHLAGWTVLRFTWAMLLHDPEYVTATILAALH